MRWLIKNPAPSDSRRMKWGDYHFGRSLTKYLERQGHDVVTQYDPGWSEDCSCDVVLVLRGKYTFPPSSHHKGALRVMWNISHPASVSLEEYATYDLVLIASRPWAASVAARLSTPVHPLLQGTDIEEFRPGAEAPKSNRSDFVFVGNTRGVERPVVRWAIEYGLPLKIWGRGWGALGLSPYVVDDYLPNEQLGHLYARSRATFNDHWDDMKRYGFINNRIFDALACGTPVISDWHDELQSLIPEGVLFYSNRAELEQRIVELLLNYPPILETAQGVGEKIRAEFSFAERASQLAKMVKELTSTSRQL